MALRTDFTHREVVRPGSETWQPLAMAGAEGYMLERSGDEDLRETLLVRCAAGLRLGTHTHRGGEEFLVLAGSFHDHAGDYPKGTSVRNPTGTMHAPLAGADGAVLFVKLHQFDAADTRRVVVDTRSTHWRQGLVDGLTVLPLHEHGHEHVAWCAGRHQPGSGRIATREARRFSCSMACSRTSTAGIRGAAGCAARTCRNTTHSRVPTGADLRRDRAPRGMTTAHSMVISGGGRQQPPTGLTP